MPAWPPWDLQQCYPIPSQMILVVNEESDELLRDRFLLTGHAAHPAADGEKRGAGALPLTRQIRGPHRQTEKRAHHGAVLYQLAQGFESTRKSGFDSDLMHLVDHDVATSRTLSRSMLARTHTSAA